MAGLEMRYDYESVKVHDGVCFGWDSADALRFEKVERDRCMEMEVTMAQAAVERTKKMWAAQRTSPVKRAMGH